MDAVWILFSCTWKALLLVAFGETIIRFWPRTSAAERHSAWGALLLALLALPALSLAWTNLSLPFLAGTGWAERTLALPQAGTVITVFGGDVQSAFPWEIAVLAVWLVGALLIGLRFAVGLLKSRRLLAGATPWAPDLRGWKGEALVVCSPAVAVPMAVGIVRPRIALPPSARNWPPATLRRVLTHEAEHIRREDGLWKLAATVVSAFYWFHPAAWRVLHALELEREHACDDAVLALGQFPSHYAEDLVTFARSFAHKPIPETAVPMASASRLETRIAAILDETKPRQTLRRKTIMIYTSAILLLLLPLSAVQSVAQLPESSGLQTEMFAAAANPQSSIPELETATLKGSPSTSSIVVNEAVTRTATGANTQPLQGSPSLQSATSKPKAIEVSQSKEEAPKRIRIGGGVMKAKLVHKVAPEYPASAKQEGVQGIVQLQVTINENGRVTDIEVKEDPDERLTKASVEAVSQWIYEPVLLNGNPVQVITTVDVNFALAK